MVDATKTSSDKAENDSGNVQVVVRVRPLISIESGSESCINVLPPSDPCNAEYCDEEEKETHAKHFKLRDTTLILTKLCNKRHHKSHSTNDVQDRCYKAA